MGNPVWVVGVGGEGRAGLPPAVRERIAAADELWGSERLLADWDDCPARKVLIDAGIGELAERLRGRGEARVVVLASGDPGFYGVAGTLLRSLPPDKVEIVPTATSLQWAFARARIPWNEAVFTSAHARPLAEVAGWARRVPRLGILTDPKHTPAAIAATLLAAGLDDCRAVVAENLGLPDERLTDARLSELPRMSFGPLNVLLLIQDDGWRPKPLLSPRPDDAYAHRRGLITKADVRALNQARLALCETDVVWDVGAGSGAMSIEMAEVAWRGQVYAVECDAENLGHIRANVERFGMLNVTLVEGRAPVALGGLPRPAAVFVGGTGGEMEGIVARVAEAGLPGCRVVMNLVTLEHLAGALAAMQAHGWAPQVTQASLAHGQALAGLTRLSPANPVFIVAGRVGTESGGPREVKPPGQDLHAG